MMHIHRTPRPCSTCGAWPQWAQHLDEKLNHLETLMTEVQGNQAHMDQDIAAIGTAVATIVQELKDQAAAGQPLDFTAADALVASTQAEATADAPAPSTPVDTGTGDDGSQPSA